MFKSILLVVAIVITLSVSNLSASCGDANGDNEINLLDITYIIDFLYLDGQTPDPIESADVNQSGSVNLLDITFLINFLYIYGPEPCYNIPWPANQNYIFEINRVNYAWGTVNLGIYIDPDGYVFEYDYGDYWYPNNSEAITEEELNQKFMFGILVDSIDIGILHERYNQLLYVATCPDTIRDYYCFDIGAWIFQGFAYNTDSDTYLPLQFYQAGDIGRKKNCPLAELLYDWLLTVDPRFEPSFCTFD